VRGIVDGERVVALPWAVDPADVDWPVHLWLGERDELVPAGLWLERRSTFPDCTTTVVRGAGHFFIGDHMARILQAL